MVLRFNKTNPDTPGILFVLKAIGKNQADYVFTNLHVKRSKTSGNVVMECSDKVRLHQYTTVHDYEEGLYEVISLKKTEVILSKLETDDFKYSDTDILFSQKKPMLLFQTGKFNGRYAEIIRAMPCNTIDVTYAKDAITSDMVEFSPGDGNEPIIITGGPYTAVVSPLRI